jgi:hypothetical protein
LADDQSAKPEAVEREARRLEKLRSLRLVPIQPDEETVASPEPDFEPKDAA